MYFLMRFYIREREDLERVTLALVWIFGLVGLGMIAEQIKGQNVFSVIGGVPLVSVIRDGKIRAQGFFVHPLTAGAIGATFLPFAFGLWWIERRHKWMAWVGVLAAVAIGVTSRSSTALLTLAAGVVGIALWRFKGHLRTIRRSIVVILIILHLVMKAPVWALIARIDLTGSSSGYHRYILVDQFIRHFSEWWLVGTRTTAGWGWDMWDTINSYVAAGTSGGLINFILFVALFVVSFKQLGRRRNQVIDEDPVLARTLWILGCVLFAHAVAFFGIAYFDQSQFIWYAGLAMMSSALAFQPSQEEDGTVADAESAEVRNWQFEDEQSEFVARTFQVKDSNLSSPVW
jgi:hypothetical protein